MPAPSLKVLAGMLTSASQEDADATMADQVASAVPPTTAASTETTVKYSSDHGQAPYQVTWISISYHRHEGLVQLPGSGDTADICRVSKPWGTKIIEWAVARLRNVPNIPSPEASDNEVLMEQLVSPIAMTVMPDAATQVYYRSGWYRYAFGKPPDFQSEPLKSPNNPALSVETPPVSPGEYQTGLTPTLS